MPSSKFWAAGCRQCRYGKLYCTCLKNLLTYLSNQPIKGFYSGLVLGPLTFLFFCFFTYTFILFILFCRARG